MHDYRRPESALLSTLKGIFLWLNGYSVHNGSRFYLLSRVIMTQSMWRLYFLVERCYKLREPVLLVGETGGGKTTVCQLLSAVIRSRLHILNCHQYTEASDFIGVSCCYLVFSILLCYFGVLTLD